MKTKISNEHLDKLVATKGYQVVFNWLKNKKNKPFDFQLATWQHISSGQSGLLNAPTGSGKTYAVFLGALISYINQHPDDFRKNKNVGLQLLWLTPLRALAQDIAKAMQEALYELEIPWSVGIRNGDTTPNTRQKQKKNMPEILLITPESWHLLLAQKDGLALFKNLKTIAIDEWHELLGNKRGVQVELALSSLKNLTHKHIAVWGISATIGNLDEAAAVLMKPVSTKYAIIKAQITKEIKVESILPDEIENYPWAGHLGLKMAEKVIPIIKKSKSTLLFINTRGMAERWYQTLLQIAPELAGLIALHHGSIEPELRLWVEEAIRTEKLKVVVCTSSLDLGVDFHPVDTVIQVGSPKGVARFLQRAGRSGHKPGQISKIYFLPTYSLELIEAAAFKIAIKNNIIESKIPLTLSYDVLIQYCCTRATGDGFNAEDLYDELRNTWSYQNLDRQTYDDILLHITIGGKSLKAYDEYHKVIVEDGIYKIKNRKIAMQHRLQIGTIVSESMIRVKLMNGAFLGMIEEYFVSKLKPGNVFTFAGRNLELVSIKDMSALVRRSDKKKAIVPAWLGGRMSLSANLGQVLRETFNIALNYTTEPELAILQHLLHIQQEVSHIPAQDELLIEYIAAKEGFHLMVYPFEGRQVHEALSALLAYRISQTIPITFSIAMNDFGFELHSDQAIDVLQINWRKLFDTENLTPDIQQSINSTEMAKRKFRDIALIGGLIHQGKPGQQVKSRHLQSSSGLLFKVFSDYEPENILLKQAYREVMEQQMDEQRLWDALIRIKNSQLIIKQPSQFSPISFPIIVDGLNRNNLSSEKMEARIKKMQEKLLQ